MSLFGVDSLPPSTARPPQAEPAETVSSPAEAKMFTPDDMVVSEQSNQPMSPIGIPSPYGMNAMSIKIIILLSATFASFSVNDIETTRTWNW